MAAEFPADVIRRCVVHGRGPQYSVEATHDCMARQVLFEKLTQTLPTILRTADDYTFRTLNGADNPTTGCLFDGIQLELRTEPRFRPEFGFCFPRRSFVRERDSFTMAGATHEPWPEWTHRNPTDADRLRINQFGHEALYFVQPPLGQPKVTVSMLKSELARSLDIVDQTRIIFTAGPFTWDASFVEDERDTYETYYQEDVVVDLRHMKTFGGAGLIYVLEGG